MSFRESSRDLKVLRDGAEMTEDGRPFQRFTGLILKKVRFARDIAPDLWSLRWWPRVFLVLDSCRRPSFTSTYLELCYI